MLRTLVSLVSTHRLEVSIVLAWAQGVSQRPVPHPSLYHVGLIQRGPNDVQQVLSHWFKRGLGRWERVSSATIGPTHSFTL